MANDVFIAFKNKDENGQTTKDCAIAQELYNLFQKPSCLRVFV